MRTFSFTFKKLLFAGILLVLLFPIIQNTINLIKVKPLQGYVIYAPDCNFSWKGWFSKDYQDQKEKYLNEEFGFRNIFLRLNHQIAFSLFNKAWASGVIIGKNNYLYERAYITAHCGQDFIGVDSITQRMQKIKFMQDTLAKMNKSFLLVLAPGKASYYPEFIPDSMSTIKGPTNYEYYHKLAIQFGINCIDFNKYFIENKHSTRYPLYPQFGIHWSYYGQFLAADSIITTLELMRKVKMPYFSWKGFAEDSVDEQDIEAGMNLLFNLKSDFKMAFPKYRIVDSGKIALSAIVVSDSHYWGMYNYGMSRILTPPHNFWYYNREIYPEFYTSQLTVSQINFKEEIAKHDVIVIICTEPNLPYLGWGFIERFYNTYSGKEATTHP